MAVKKHGVHFDITAENATDRALRAVEDNLGRVNKAADAVGRVLKGAFIATTAIAAGKAFAEAAIAAEQASKRLDAVLKATGHSAGLTKEELDGMAEALAASTQFDDTGLRNAAAQMLKFGNIHGETFRQAMKLSADLAAFMGTDLNSAVQAVGKALTSPAEGLGALEKQIGKFNPASEAMIKSLVEQGRAGRAQAEVLDLLRGKIGGAAEALNTGLFKGAEDMKKSWSAMLESIGKTDSVSGNTSKGLLVMNNYLRNIKDTIENGDWVEKTLAILALAGGAGGHRRFNLSPPAAAARNTVKGPIIGAPAAMNPSAELTGIPMSERDIKAWKEMLEGRKRLAEEAKKRQEEQIREDEKLARQHVEIEEAAAKEVAEAWDHWGKIVLDNEKKRNDDRAEMWKQVFATIDQEQEDAIEAGKMLLDQVDEDAKRAEEAARQLGLTFTSAFEDAVIGGKALSEVLRGIGMDVARIILRKGVTEPLAGAATDWLKSSGLTEGFKGLFRAAGGPVSAGEMYMVGERGQEMFVPDSNGTIIPNDALRASSSSGASITVNQTVNIDSRSDQATIMAGMAAARNAAVAEVRSLLRSGSPFLAG